MFQNNVETKVCRLCGSENGILINIFESSPNNECITKIEAVVPDVVILREDSLSKHICHRCVAKVKEFYDFKGVCIRTQSILKSRLPWMSSDQKTIPLRAVSPTIKFIGGPLAYPFGQKEPEVEVLTLSDDEDRVETSAPLKVDLPSGHVQPQVIKSLKTNGLTSPVSPKDSRTQPSPASGHLRVESVWNGNTALGSGTQNSARMGSGGRMMHSFQSYINNFDQPATTNQPGYHYYPETASGPCALPPAKRTCRPSQSRSPKKCESDNLSVNRRSVNTFSTPTPVATPSSSRNSNLATPSIMPRSFSVATPPNMPISSTAANPSSIYENCLKDVSLVQVGNSVSTPRLNENSKNAVPRDSVHNNSSEHKHSGSELLSGNEIRTSDSPVLPAKPKPKPKPKSKKKPVKLTEADINNIRSKYPTINDVKINGNTTIFTCTLCNKMLLTEEAICNHECLSPVENEAKDSSSRNDCSYYVELSSDDEMSNDAERHMCTICGRLFHSNSRLQKHLELHV